MPERKPIKVLANCMAVVDTIAERGDLSPAEIASATGLPRPSVYRLIDGLRAVGLLTVTPESRARLSVKWLHLADAARAAMVEWTGAHATLVELAGRSEQTLFLTVPRGDEAFCIDWSVGSGIGVLSLSPGRSLPLYAGGAGRLTLAYAADVEKYLRDGPQRRPLTPHTLTDADALRADVTRTRAQQYTLSLDDATVGIGAIAVPILTPERRLRGCLSLAGRSADIRAHHDEFLAMSLAAARAMADDATRALSDQTS